MNLAIAQPVAVRPRAYAFIRRRTAAASRERKKEQQSKLDKDIQKLRREVESLRLALRARDDEVARLKALAAASPTTGAAGAGRLGLGTSVKRSIPESALGDFPFLLLP